MSPQQGSRFDLYFPVHVGSGPPAKSCCSVFVYGLNNEEQELLQQSLSTFPCQVEFYTQLSAMQAAYQAISRPALMILPLSDFEGLESRPTDQRRVLCLSSDSEADLQRLDALPAFADALVMPFDEFQLKHRVHSIMRDFWCF